MPDQAQTDATANSTSTNGSRPPAQGASVAITAVLILIALSSIIALAVMIYLQQERPMVEVIERYRSQNAREAEDLIIIALIERYIPSIFLLIIFAVSTYFATSFWKSSQLDRSSVIPIRDAKLIERAIIDGKPEPIDQYIRLSSLRGGVGIFTKVGLTGLPLATIALTLVFAGLALSSPFSEKGESKVFDAFIDLTKLTLGAFIGSFVQRQVEARRQETEIKRAIESVARSGGPTGTGG